MSTLYYKWWRRYSRLMKWEAYWCSMPSNARYAGRSPQCSRSNIEWWRDVDDVDSKDDDEDSNNNMMMMKMMSLIILMIPHDWQGSDGCWIFQKETLLQHSSIQNFENNDFLLITPFFWQKIDFRSTSLQLPLQFWNWCCSKFVWQASSISKQHRYTICKWNRGILPFSRSSKY